MKRSCFTLAFVKYVFEQLAAIDFADVPGDLCALLSRVFSSFVSTKLVEDAFQRIRSLESDRADKVLTNASIWMQPVAKALISQSYEYREVQVINTADETSEAKKESLPEGLFTPAKKKASMATEFAKLPGYPALHRACSVQVGSRMALGYVCAHLPS